MWVNCPMCGEELAGWEDNYDICFCGECEKRYQESLNQTEVETNITVYPKELV